MARVSGSELMGRNAYARHRGCSPNAVLKAVADGRIAAAAVVVAGKIKAIRWRLADELWAANTDPTQVRHRPGGRVHASGLEEDVRLFLQGMLSGVANLITAASPARRPAILQSIRAFAASLESGAAPQRDADGQSAEVPAKR